jgi:hypothetical protein
MTTERLPRTRNGRPRISRVDDVVDYWLERAQTPLRTLDSLGQAYEQVHKSSLFYEGDHFYHYGHHYRFATVERTPTGRFRRVLLNRDDGASYGPGGFGESTASRWWHLKRLLERNAIPYSLDPSDEQVARNERHDARQRSLKVSERHATVRLLLQALSEPTPVTHFAAREVFWWLQGSHSPNAGRFIEWNANNATIKIRTGVERTIMRRILLEEATRLSHSRVLTAGMVLRSVL